MAWKTTRSTNLIMAAMIGEAVAIEFLRSLAPEERKAAADRIMGRFLQSVKDYSEAPVHSPDPQHVVGHRIMADEMKHGCEGVLQALLDAAEH